MIKNPDILKELERKIITERKSSFLESLKIFEAMWQEGVNLGVLPLKDPLEGIDVDIKIAKVLCLKKYSKR